MPLSPLKQSRLASGLCLQCGAPRTGPGAQARLCPRCADAMREAKRRWRDRHKDDPDYRAQNRETAARIREARAGLGQCPRCGRVLPSCQAQASRSGGDSLDHSRTPPSPRNEGLEREGTARRAKRQSAGVGLSGAWDFKGQNCPACRAELRRLNTALRQRNRDRAAGLPDDSPHHWPVGVHPAHLPGGGTRVTFAIDRRALAALQTLIRQRREQFRETGATVEVRDRSQIVRDVIAAYRFQPDCPVRWDSWLFTTQTFTVNLDAPSLAILDRLAAAQPSFKGSRSAALRAILLFAVEPPIVPRASGTRLSAGYGSTGSRYRLSYAPPAYHCHWDD